MATKNSTLTDAGIKRLPVKRSKYRVRDGMRDPDLKGFGVVVHTSGTRSFFLSYTSPETGNRTEGALGVHPSLSLKDARVRARQWRQRVREGVDPKLELQREKEAARVAHGQAEAKQERKRSLGTVADLFSFYVSDMEADGKRSAEDVQSAYRRDIRSAIGHLKAADVTEAQCEDIIAAVADRGARVLANRTRSYLIAAFAFGMEAKKMPRWRKTVPVFDIKTNPAAGTRKALDESEIVGQRALSAEELHQVWFALDTPHETVGGGGARRMVTVDAYTSTAIKLLLATGQRTEEVLHAQWSEFDLEQRLWTIPAARRKNRHKNKSKEPHLVPLEQLHIDLLEQLKPYSGEGRYLFPTKGGNSPRSHTGLAQAVRRLCARLQMDPWSPRDIRRTWKTLGGSLRIDLELRNRIQGHAFSDVGSRHYDRWGYLDEKREAMAVWCGWLTSLLASGENVVLLKRADR